MKWSLILAVLLAFSPLAAIAADSSNDHNEQLEQVQYLAKKIPELGIFKVIIIYSIENQAHTTPFKKQLIDRFSDSFRGAIVGEYEFMQDDTLSIRTLVDSLADIEFDGVLVLDSNAFQNKLATRLARKNHKWVRVFALSDSNQKSSFKSEGHHLDGVIIPEQSSEAPGDYRLMIANKNRFDVLLK